MSIKIFKSLICTFYYLNDKTVSPHFALTAWSILLMLVGIFLFALVFLSLRWQQTECQCVTLSPVSPVTLVSFSPDIQSKYLVTISLRNKLPGRLCCFKKLARGPGKRKRNVSSNVWCLFVSLLGSILLCVPRQARLSSVALESYCSPPTFTIWTKERKRWQL